MNAQSTSLFLPRPLLACFMALLILAGCASTPDAPVEALRIAGPPGRYAALVVDASTGRQLYEVSSTAQRYPASLTKMMTLFLLFEALRSGEISRATEIPVSDNAARQPPTKIGFRRGGSIDVESAIQALTVKSANDVAVAVAEFLAGSEAEFAGRMTARARQLGMTGTVFVNASGLPDAGQFTTARDMALLGLALRRDFAQYYGYFSASDFTYKGRRVRGHNDMLGRVAGVDGIKTGYIKASGYNVVTSVRTAGRSLIVVVMGAESARARNAHVEELIARYLPQAGM